MKKPTIDDRDADWKSECARIAKGIRRRVLIHTINNNGGYLSQACSSAEILATLYHRIMHLGPSLGPQVPRSFAGTPGPGNPNSFTGAEYNGPRGEKWDRFIFSPVHYALVLYSTLIEVGRLSPDALDHFNQDGSTMELIGAEHSPGHEVTAGSLGQAISQAGGIALARKLRNETGRVWVFMSDGEFQEGQVWEAIAACTHHALGNIGIYVDVNGQCCDGRIETVMKTEPLGERLRAFGAQVHEVDGHDIEALATPTDLRPTDRPMVVLARTDPCRGIDIMRERAPFLHYMRFRSDSERHAYETVLENE